MKTKEEPINIDGDNYDDRFEENIEADNEQTNVPQGVQGDTSGTKPYVTRSVRVVKVPIRLKDYVT